MYLVCLNSKYGFCKYGKCCDKIHLTDECKNLLKCTEKYCDKRHPQVCFYFEKYGRCKFNSDCSYSHHDTNIKEISQKTTFSEIEEEVVKLKHDVVSLEEKVGHLILEIEKIKSFKDTVSEVITDDNINEDIVPVVLVKHSEKVPAAKNENLVEQFDNTNMSLQSVIMEVSGYKCEYCSFVAKTERKLSNHKIGSHTVEDDYWNS